MSSDTSLVTFNADHNPLLELSLRDGANTTALVVLLAIYLVGLIIASFTDLFRGRQTPNWFTHSTVLIGLVAAPLVFENWATHYIIAASVGGVFLLGWWFAGIGMGDVKLYTGMALLFGWPALFMLGVAHVAAAVIGGPVALARRTRKMAVPMFPFVAIGVLVTAPAIGAPMWLSLAGGCALAAAGLYGLLERRYFPLATLIDMASPLNPEVQKVRVRPGERLLMPDGPDGWTSVPGTRRVSGGAIDAAVAALLDHDQWKAFERAGELRVHADGIHVHIGEGINGYTLTLAKSDAAKSPEGAAA